MLDRKEGWLRIPLDGEEDLPWDYFVLQAARGAVRVPHWVLLAVPAAVGRKLGKPPADVTGEDVDAALADVGDPEPVLADLLRRARVTMPDPAKDRPRLDPSRVRGTFREAVAVPELLHDVALAVRTRFDAGRFEECVDAIHGDDWDAVRAVEAMIYLVACAWRTSA